MRRNDFHKSAVFSAITILAIFLMTACGGGGGTTAGGGIGGTGVIASGAVTAKGSVHVNGAIYNTDTAIFTIDDSPGTEAGVRRGMVVRVDGTRETIATGIANTVVYEDVVKGPITDINTSVQTTTLTVLGQTVIIEQDITLVDDNAGDVTTTLPTFNINDEIEVSGLRETIVGGFAVTNGPIRATYIDVKEPLISEYEVKGVIENAATNSFDIAGLQVSFSGSVPANGTTVEVKGLSSTFTTPPDALVATSVEVRVSGLGEVEFDHAEVEGFLGNLTATTFTLNDQPVNFTGAIFKGGVASDLNNGTKVEAEGPIMGGILVAEKIEFKENIRIEANIASIGTDSITLKGLETITVVTSDALTEYQNTTGIGGGNPLTIGDHIEIRGRTGQTASTVIATEIRNDGTVSEPYRVILRGPEENNPVVFDTVRILGIDQDTSTIPLNEFSIENDDGTDTPVSKNEFFNTLLQTGDIVKLRTDSMTSAHTAPAWERAEIEND